MRIRLLFFASYRDLAGRDSLDLEVPAGADAAHAIRLARLATPLLGRLPARPAVAVNESYAALATPLNEGDELALLPPVAGG